MHHNLDINPIPERVLYVNDLTIAADTPYQLQGELDKAMTGKQRKDGGILPDDNVRIYIPLDLNAENILYQLQSIFQKLGSPSWDNENTYTVETGKIIAQLEIYDQVWAARGHFDTISNEPGVKHSREGIELARKIVKYLEEKDGTADSFPYELIDELREEFGCEA